MALGSAPTCDFRDCGIPRTETNHWFVVHKDTVGTHIYEWDECPVKAMKEGLHLCGNDHMIRTVSRLTTIDITDANRESTLELKPPFKDAAIVTVDEPEQEKGEG